MKRRSIVYAIGYTALAFLVVAYFIHPVGRRFTFDTVAKLHKGQTYAEVVAILGKPDNVQTTENLSRYGVRAQWGEYGLDKKPYIGVTFVNGEVDRMTVLHIPAPNDSPDDPYTS